MNDYDETITDCIRAGVCHWDGCQERGRKMIDIPLSLAMAALELLKAQEPRVMTLEEAKNSEFCFCESGSVFACHMFVDPADGFATIQQFGRPDILIDSNEYGISFRCWTSRPTDEQREKVKWE
jgi:hypothetical protein